MSAVCYALMLIAVVWMSFTLGANPWHAGTMVLIVSMSVIGVHGILSGTATMDFGGAKNTGTAVGVVDGVVYMGTALQSFVIGRLSPAGDLKIDPENWRAWPLFLAPMAAIGLLLAIRIWNARPRVRPLEVAPAEAPRSTRAPVPALSTDAP
jgi:OPA family glycerol-3-phosphate transporter-like MFS transporter